MIRTVGSPNKVPASQWIGSWIGLNQHWPRIHRTVYASWAARGRSLLLRLVIVVCIPIWLILQALGLGDIVDPHPAILISLTQLPLAEHIRSRLSTRRTRRRWRSEARPQWRPYGRIDAGLDELLREGLDAALGQDGPRIEQAAANVKALGPDLTRHFQELLVAVNAMALYAVSGECWPDREDLKDLAEEFSRAHEHLELPEDWVRHFVTCLPKTNPMSATFLTSQILPIGFAFGAWLLSSFPKPDNLGAWGFLHEIEDALGTGEGRFPEVRFV